MSKLSFGIIIVFFFTAYQLHSHPKDSINGELEDNLGYNLPPLSLLFENARNSATIKYYDARKESEKSMLKTVKNQWLKYFKIVGAYQYGVMGTTSSMNDQGDNQVPVYHLSNSHQSFYNLGLAVSVPLDELFDRGNKVRRQKMEMKATEAEVERWHDEQKIRIIELYSKAELYLNLLKLKSEAMIIARTQYQTAESDFINGKIRTSDLSARKGVETDAIVNYEQTKSELNKALLQLEILSKTKIINK